MSSSIANKENELDQKLSSNLAARKGRSAGTRRSFGSLLGNAMNEIREDNDLKMAVKYQSMESDSYIHQRYCDEKQCKSGEREILHVYCQQQYITTVNPHHPDREYADKLSREEFERSVSGHAEDKHSTHRSPSGAAAGPTTPASEEKGYRFEINYDEDEKAYTPLQKGDIYCEKDGFLEEDVDLREDERMANSLHIAERKELHKQNIGYLFDADYAKHLAEDENHDSKQCYESYVAKKWENVESYLDDVESGICISLLLPELSTYDVSIFENYSIQVDAVKKRSPSDINTESVEYKADYSFEGATKGITGQMIEYEYISTAGILFIFVDRLKLRGPSSQCFVSPSKGKTDDVEYNSKPQLANATEDNHFVNKNKGGETRRAKNSFMLRVRKSALGRILSIGGGN